jgi:hypothetical protein
VSCAMTAIHQRCRLLNLSPLRFSTIPYPIFVPAQPTFLERRAFSPGNRLARIYFTPTSVDTAAHETCNARTCSGLI